MFLCGKLFPQAQKIGWVVSWPRSFTGLQCQGKTAPHFRLLSGHRVAGHTQLLWVLLSPALGSRRDSPLGLTVPRVEEKIPLTQQSRAETSSLDFSKNVWKDGERKMQGTSQNYT